MNKKYGKQRLFEMMSKLDTSFKSTLAEGFTVDQIKNTVQNNLKELTFTTYVDNQPKNETVKISNVLNVQLDKNNKLLVDLKVRGNQFYNEITITVEDNMDRTTVYNKYNNKVISTKVIPEISSWLVGVRKYYIEAVSGTNTQTT
jgi:hypothetical protein